MTARRLIRLMSGSSLQEVAAKLDPSAKAHEKANALTGEPFDYRVDQLLRHRADAEQVGILSGGVVGAYLAPGQALPAGWGESQLLGGMPSFDLRIDFERLWAKREFVAGLLARLLVELVVDSDISGGLIADQEIATIAAWNHDEGLRVFEPAGHMFDAGAESRRDQALENYLLFEPKLAEAAQASDVELSHAFIDFDVF